MFPTRSSLVKEPEAFAPAVEAFSSAAKRELTPAGSACQQLFFVPRKFFRSAPPFGFPSGGAEAGIYSASLSLSTVFFNPSEFFFQTRRPTLQPPRGNLKRLFILPHPEQPVNNLFSESKKTTALSLSSLPRRPALLQLELPSRSGEDGLCTSAPLLSTPFLQFFSSIPKTILPGSNAYFITQGHSNAFFLLADCTGAEYYGVIFFAQDSATTFLSLQTSGATRTPSGTAHNPRHVPSLTRTHRFLCNSPCSAHAAFSFSHTAFFPSFFSPRTRFPNRRTGSPPCRRNRNRRQILQSNRLWPAARGKRPSPSAGNSLSHLQRFSLCLSTTTSRSPCSGFPTSRER